MKLASFLTFASLAVCAFAQTIEIGYPYHFKPIKPGQHLTVQVNRPVRIQPSSTVLGSALKIKRTLAGYPDALPGSCDYDLDAAVSQKRSLPQTIRCPRHYPLRGPLRPPVPDVQYAAERAAAELHRDGARLLQVRSQGAARRDPPVARWRKWQSFLGLSFRGAVLYADDEGIVLQAGPFPMFEIKNVTLKVE